MRIDYVICNKCDVPYKPLWSKTIDGKNKTTEYICPECGNKITVKETVGSDEFCKNHCHIYGLQKQDKLK